MYLRLHLMILLAASAARVPARPATDACEAAIQEN